jgi:hypothetical protein
MAKHTYSVTGFYIDPEATEEYSRFTLFISRDTYFNCEDFSSLRSEVAQKIYEQTDYLPDIKSVAIEQFFLISPTTS